MFILLIVSLHNIEKSQKILGHSVSLSVGENFFEKIVRFLEGIGGK